MNVPSGYTALDLIGFTDRGDYDSTANYVKNDLVHHNNSIWRCLVDDTTAVTPAEGANWTVYIQNGTTLNGMADVNLTTPANGDLLRYNSTSSKWENQDVDSTPTQSSTKLVQSGGVYTQLAGKADTADLATVATTGVYSDLSGAPQLAQVATTGQYSDLSGQPTIPTVNDATLTIQKNGTNVETFTANSSTNKTANITVPDVINDLSDVNISSVANEEILAYDSTSSKWKNSGALGALKETLENEVVTRATLGAHNLNTYPYTNGTTNTYNIDFTDLGDGTVKVGGAQSQTSSGSAIWNCHKRYGGSGYTTNPLFLKNGTYNLSGGINKDCTLSVYVTQSSSGVLLGKDSGTEVTFTVNGDDSSNDGAYIQLRIDVPSGKTIPAGGYIVKPMICLASDTDSTYQPYAMTNKELTDVVEQEIGNYMYEGVHTASVSADGVKDYETLINDLSVTMLAKLQALADDEIVFIKQVSIGDNTSPTINKFISEFKNTATSFDIDYSKTTINVGTGVNIIWGRLNTTKSGVRCASVSLNAGTAVPTPTDLRSTVPTSGTSFAVYYQVYKKIS